MGKGGSLGGGGGGRRWVMIFVNEDTVNLRNYVPWFHYENLLQVKEMQNWRAMLLSTPNKAIFGSETYRKKRKGVDLLF